MFVDFYTEWLLIDKTGDLFYFKDISCIAKYIDKTKPQVYNIIIQSIKNTNKLHKSGFYIQRLYIDKSRTPKKDYRNRNKYIYFTNHTQEDKNYILNNL